MRINGLQCATLYYIRAIPSPTPSDSLTSPSDSLTFPSDSLTFCITKSHTRLDAFAPCECAMYESLRKNGPPDG